MSSTSTAQAEAVRLYVGGHGTRINGDPFNLAGYRCFSAAHRPGHWPVDPGCLFGLLDSGAFTDPPHARLTPTQALDRQLAWETRASLLWNQEWQAQALVSYDLLIDEVWTHGERVKRRWTVSAAEYAVAVTADAARYLAAQRDRLAARTLVLSCQGVDAVQYAECAAEVLRVAAPNDWIGLGGWCILGRWRSWLPQFWATLRLILPRVAAAGVRHVHLFGVLWPVALGGLVWLADRVGLSVSADSTAPVLACTRRNARKAGVRAAHWRENVRWWRETLANLRDSEHYREPPSSMPTRQLAFM